MEVRLRAALQADAEILASWETDEVFCRQAGWRPHATYDDAVKWWRPRLRTPKPGSIRLIAVNEDAVVGYADIYGTDPEERELGYAVGPSSAWGHGLGTAVARAGVAYAFEELNLQRIWAEAVLAAPASVGILRRIGMREIGLGSEEDYLGVPSRYLQFEITRSVWSATAHP